VILLQRSTWLNLCSIKELGYLQLYSAVLPTDSYVFNRRNAVLSSSRGWYEYSEHTHK
jgi:hypothetical protein